MNATTLNFLKAMMERIEAEVGIAMATMVSEKASKNLQTLIKEGIITKADAETFATSCGITIAPTVTQRTATTTTKKAISDDVCGRGGGVSRSSC